MVVVLGERERGALELCGDRRQPEAGDVEQRGEALIRDLDVDVLEMDRVAEVLGGSIEWLRYESGSGGDGRMHIKALSSEVETGSRNSASRNG